MKHFDKDNLPLPISEMALHRKKTLTPMIMVDGPFSVETQEGKYELPEGWRGFVAVDNEGFPYPISLENYHSSYEPVGDMRIPRY
jgi:hypothetical protein